MMRGYDFFTPYTSGGFYDNSWMFWLMGIGRVLVLVAVIWLIVWAVKRFTGNHSTGYTSGDDEALSIVRERYARGEISKEEFDVLTKDLENTKRRK